MGVNGRRWAVAAGLACLVIGATAGRDARAGAVGDAYGMSPSVKTNYSTAGIAMNRDNGSFAVLMYTDTTDPQGPLKLRVYDAQGVPTTSMKSIAAQGYSQNSGRIVIDPRGRILVFWSVYDGPLQCQLFDPHGNPIGGVKNLAEHVSPIFNLLSNSAGKYLLYWSYYNLDYVLPFDPDSDTQEAPIVLKGPSSAVPPEQPGMFSAAMDENGGFVVAWSRGRQVQVWGQYFYLTNLYAQRYDPLGQLVGKEIALTHDTETGHSVWGVFPDPKGGFTVLWYRQRLGLDGLLEDPGYFAQTRDGDGEIVRDTFPFQPGSGPNFYPKVYPDGTGRYLVQWTDGSGLHSQWYDSAWMPLGKRYDLSPSVPLYGNWTTAVDGKGNVEMLLDTTKDWRPESFVAVARQRFAFGTETRVEASPSPAAPSGDYLTFTAEVSAPPGAEIPTGSVAFSDGGKLLGLIPLSADGRADYVTRSLAPGTHKIRAEYVSGDSYFGSAAELEGGLTVLPTGAPGGAGDLNGDGTVGVEDAVALLRSLVTGAGMTPEQTVAADVNGDGSVDVADAVALLRLAVGLPPS